MAKDDRNETSSDAVTFAPLCSSRTSFSAALVAVFRSQRRGRRCVATSGVPMAGLAAARTTPSAPLVRDELEVVEDRVTPRGWTTAGNSQSTPRHPAGRKAYALTGMKSLMEGAHDRAKILPEQRASSPNGHLIGPVRRMGI
jgi:hypothetical protein